MNGGEKTDQLRALRPKEQAQWCIPRFWGVILLYRFRLVAEEAST